MTRKYLLGATTENEIVFGEFGITTRNGYPEFTASFNTVRPFTADEVNAKEYYEDLMDSYGKADLYDLCERYDVSPSELPETLADELGENPQDIRDCSLYPEIINVYNTDYYFESCSCGQHDTRGEMSEVINQAAYDRLNALWDAHHLKEVGEEVAAEVESLQAMLYESYSADPESWIADYIKRNY